MAHLISPALTGCGQLDITDQYESGPVLAALREINESSAVARASGFVWLFQLGQSEDDPALAVVCEVRLARWSGMRSRAGLFPQVA